MTLKRFGARLPHPPSGLADKLEPADEPEPAIAHAFETELGWMALCDTPGGIRQLTFGFASAAEALRALDDPAELRFQGRLWHPQASKLLQAFARGKPVDLAPIPLALPPGTPFQGQVLAACRAIPYGETRTYQELAIAAGTPRAARAVGNVMCHVRVPILMPCHRVVAAADKLPGDPNFPQLALSDLTSRQRLLFLEARGKRKTNRNG